MKKLIKVAIIPLTMFALASCVMPGGGGGGGGESSSSSSSAKSQTHYSDGEVSDTFNGYYDLSKYDLNGTRSVYLQAEINKLLWDTTTKFVKYADFAKYIKPNASLNNGVSIDQVSATNLHNQFFYTGKEVEFSTSMTREHVWPCAKSGGLWTHNKSDGVYYVDGANYAGGGSDLYHVRPCRGDINTLRGSSRFKEFSEEEKAIAYKGNDGGPYVLLADADGEFANYSEPADEFKGDIARILVYVYIHYSKIGNYWQEKGWNNYVTGLNLQDVMGYDNQRDVRETLARWNAIDPVSETEKLRNDTVQKIQGNRNPFVDYPHLLAKCLNVD